GEPFFLIFVFLALVIFFYLAFSFFTLLFKLSLGAFQGGRSVWIHFKIMHKLGHALAKTKFEQTLVENLYRAGVFIKLEILIFRVHIFTFTCLDPTGSFLHTHYCLYSGY
ncbi:hypothetical protein ACJX0J_028306, partial [Zea mays]